MKTAKESPLVKDLKEQIEKAKKVSAWHFERANAAEQGKWKSATDSAHDAWKLKIIQLIAKGDQVAAILMLIEGPQLEVQFQVSYAGAPAPATEKSK